MDTFEAMPHVEGVTHHVAVVDGLRLHYAQAGEGESLLLVHGWPQHWWSWRHVIPALAQRYRVICPDIRGLGWSDGPGAASRMEDFSLSRLARDTIGLLDALGIRRARYVGHDWGCIAGYRVAIDHPDRIVRFVGLGGVHPWSAPAPPRLYLRPWHLWGYALLGAPFNALDVPRVCLRTWRHAGRFTDEEETAYVGRLTRSGAAAATRAYDRNIVFREIPHFVRHHRSIQVRVPVLHLNGAEDPLTVGVPRNFRRYADEMRFEHVPDCGHFLAEERPDELLDRVTDFLAA